MPFKSDKQKRWMYANKPKMAKEWEKYAQGGLVDNIKALLTEGEYVIRKEAAESIGYDNLNEMNETGNLPRITDARKRRK